MVTVGRGLRAVRSVLPGPRATPFTSALLLVLAATTVVLRWGESDDAAVLRWSSTNLINLNHHPVSALLASAFVSDGNITFNFIVLGIACAALERRSSAGRTALVVTAGHVIATLITEGAVRIAIAAHGDPRAAARQLDIGISYVMYTAVGAVLGFLPRRWRGAAVAGAVAYVGMSFVRDPGMTPSGHLLSLAIGVLSWPLLMPAGDAEAVPPRRRVLLARLRSADGARVRIAALAGLTAVGLLTACAPGHYLLDRGGHHARCATAAPCAGMPQPGR